MIARENTEPAKTSASKMNWETLKDLLLVVATLVIVKQSVLPYSMVYAGPASTFAAMALATYLLFRRGLG